MVERDSDRWRLDGRAENRRRGPSKDKINSPWRRPFISCEGLGRRRHPCFGVGLEIAIADEAGDRWRLRESVEDVEVASDYRGHVRMEAADSMLQDPFDVVDLSSRCAAIVDISNRHTEVGAVDQKLFGRPEILKPCPASNPIAPAIVIFAEQNRTASNERKALCVVDDRDAALRIAVEQKRWAKARNQLVAAIALLNSDNFSQVIGGKPYRFGSSIRRC